MQNSWRLALGGMAAMAAGVGVGRFVYTPILPVMVEGLHLTTSQAGLIASANFLGYLAGALLAASSRLRGSRRSYLVGGLAVSALAMAAMGATQAFFLHLALRFIGGVASAFILVFASALVLERLSASGNNRLSALHFAGVGLGIAISAAMVSALLAIGADWRALWFASTVLGLAGLAFAAALVNADAAPRTDRLMEAAGRSSFPLRAIITAYGLFGFGYVITATFIVAMVRSSPSIRAMEPYVWVLFGLSAAPSVALWMRLGSAFGVIQTFAIACLVEAAGVASSILWVSAAGIVVAVVFLGGTFVGITALGLVAVRRFSSGDPRPNLGLATAAFGAGQAVGPAFAGFVFDRLGSFAIPSLTAAAALIAAAGLASLAAASEDKRLAAAAPQAGRHA
jgi:predicted MFS family arabinose efflux permease